MEPEEIRVPEPELAKFKLIAGTPKELLEKIAHELQVIDPTIELDNISNIISEKYKLPKDKIYSILTILRNWVSIHRKLNLSAENFIKGVSSFLSREVDSEKWSKEDEEAWRERCDLVKQSITLNSALALKSKAMDLLLTHELVMCDSQVITDIRPVFDDLAETLKGYLTFHILVINCFKGDETIDLHIAMDENDLKKLRNQLERGERKENKIRNQITKDGLPIFKPDLH